MSSPYEKVKKSLEAIGYTVGKTEHWNPFAHIRQDLFGVIDLIAMRHGDPLLAVQVTSRSHVSERMKKAHAVAVQWVSTGNRFEVWGTEARKPMRVMRMLSDGTWESKD